MLLIFFFYGVDDTALWFLARVFPPFFFLTFFFFSYTLPRATILHYRFLGIKKTSRCLIIFFLFLKGMQNYSVFVFVFFFYIFMAFHAQRVSVICLCCLSLFVHFSSFLMGFFLSFLCARCQPTIRYCFSSFFPR